ncbi:MAG: hypothetical protein AAF289_06125 [Cyanobacteria bacterium P01_A01_bin.135]
MPGSIGADSTATGGVPAAGNDLMGAVGAETSTASTLPASKAQAMLQGAAQQAGQMPTEGGSIEGQIASAEGERDTAVSEHLASTVELQDVLARSRGLGSGVSFPAVANPQQFKARQTALAETQNFMSEAANQIAAAVAFAEDQVPEMLRAAAETAKASIQGTIETEKAAISARIARAQAQARNGAAAARDHVNNEYASSAATIEAVTLEVLTALDTKHIESVMQVDEKETVGLDDVNARFATGRTQHEAKGPEYADRALARGQEYVARYERCKGDYSDDGFWDGCLTVRRARAQQDAACKTAAGYKDTFLETANRKGYDLIALRRQYRCAVISGARQVTQTLDDTHDQLVSGLESGRMQALDGIAMARDENLAAIDKALTATLEALSHQEVSQRQTINDTGYLKQLAIEQLTHTGAAGLSRGIASAMDALEQTLMALQESFAQGDIPDPAMLGQSLAMAQAALGGGMGTLLDKMTQGAQEAGASIEGLGESALEALALITTKNDGLSTRAEAGFSQQMRQLRSGASDAFAQLTENHVQQAQRAMTDGTATMDQAVTGFNQALTTIGGRVDEAIATSLQELEQQLSSKLGELDSQITAEAWRAAEKEQPAWKSVVAIVLIILVVIAAAVISVVTLGAGASLFAIILVGALVGAISGGLIQLINNWASGEAWHQGLAQAIVMGAVGGAIGGGLGFAGGALAAGAAGAGARAATQLAISLGADIAAEAATQTFGYVAFGQQFNWQGFVMAGAMSGMSFRAQPGGRPRPGVPAAEVPTPAAAGSAAGRRAAVTQVAGGAAVGFGAEYVTSAVSGQEFDLNKAAAAAASGAVGARMARRGGTPDAPEAPTPPRQPADAAPATPSRPATGAEPEPSSQPSFTSRASSRLEELGGRLIGARPSAEVPTGARPQAGTATVRPDEEPATASRASEEATSSRPMRPHESDIGPRQIPPDEPSVELGRRPIDADTAAELAGPANRMNEQDLIDTTTTTARIGDTEHDFHISQKGPEVCTACDPTVQRLSEMIAALPSGALRRRLERLRSGVGAVKTRLENGESGVNMVRDSARIAAEFRALSEVHPIIGRSLQEPQLRQRPLEGADSGVMTSRHLQDLDAEVVLARTINAADFRSVPMSKGDQAVYVLRDRSSGAILKVGIAKNHLGRVTQYSNAGKKLGLELDLDVAIVQPGSGKSIRDIERDLRSRLSDEGHVLPWDNSGQRLGRADRGTPFVHPVSDNLMWDAYGNLVQKGTGAPPPATRRARSTPEEVAQLLHQGYTPTEIAMLKGVAASTVRSWKSRWKNEINTILDRLMAVDQVYD